MVARPLYTVRIASLTAGPAATTNYGPVPVGDIWVVRSIEAMNWGGASAVRNGFRVETSSQGFIFGAGPPYSWPNVPFHWDGRQVIEAAEYLAIETFDANWEISVSGYQLTAT
jgi:hypothetical protein